MSERSGSRTVRTCTVLGAMLLATSWLAAAESNKTRKASEVEEQMRKDITFLASDECEGRGVTTKGVNLAADFIAEEFKKAGLQPIDKAGYFQNFSVITGAAKLDSPNTLVLTGPNDKQIELRMGEQFIPVGLSDAGKIEAPLVFVGYGATANEIKYDDYKDVDVAGKIVIVLRKTPRPENRDAPFEGGPEGAHAALTTKLVNAGLHKAAAVLFVNDRTFAKGGDTLMDFAYTAGARQSFGVKAAQIRRSVLDDLLQSGAGIALKDVEADIDRDLKPHSLALTGWSAALEINLTRVRSKVKNVIGVLEGTGDLAGETVVIGAHYDHLGYGGRGSGSLAKDQEAKEIHHGADDNGSGTTTLLEMARSFGALKERKGRRLVFIAFTGEESGLLGSEYYCKEPIYPLADTVTMINLDMVGRLREDMTAKKDKLYIYGSGTSKGFDELISGLNKEYDFQMQKIAGTRMAGGSSDHASFYAKKVPVLFLFTGNHPDYHRPSDTADKINVAGMRKIAEFTEDVVEQLASQAERPQYIKVDQGPLVSPGGGGPRLGIMPSYGDDKEGVLLEGVREGTPADKAQLKEGDRIVELDGKAVKNLEAYMVLMAGHKKGDAMEIVVLRDGKKVTLKAKLE
jgi:hypothetical protein